MRDILVKEEKTYCYTCGKELSTGEKAYNLDGECLCEECWQEHLNELSDEAEFIVEEVEIWKSL